MPEVASLQGDEGVTGPAHELVSTSCHISEEEKEDEAAVSYAYLKSTITGEDSV